MKYTVTLVVALSAIWLLWSGHYTPLLLSLGLVSVVTVAVLARTMNLIDHEGSPVELLIPGLRYLPWLIGQIIVSNVDVARRILDPRLPISPRMIRVRCLQKRDIGRVVLANSITLTPGTVSVETEGEFITVHALTDRSAEGVEEGNMNRRVKRLEGRD